MKVKKQHYVPSCYLRKFTIDNKLHIYDKELKEYRNRQSPNKIACVNGFYDLNDDEINAMNLNSTFELGEQYIEHFFSSKIEGKLSLLIDNLNKNIPKVCNIFSIKLDKSLKNLIAEQVSYQLIRTYGFRKGIGLAYPDKTEIEVSELHKKVILSKKLLKKNKEMFLSFNWDINYDNKGRFLTSDDPVVFHQFKGESNNHIISQFIYPLSPHLLITMTSDLIKGKKIDISEARLNTDDNLINFLNYKQLENATRFIIIPHNNEIINDILKISNKVQISAELLERLDSIKKKQIEMIKTGNINDSNTKKIRAELNEIMSKINNKI